MTGDELPYPYVSRHQVEAVFGEKLDEDIPLDEAVAAAAESFNLFFLIPDLARRQRCEQRWLQLLGDHVICMETAAGIVALGEGALADLDAYVAALRRTGVGREAAERAARALAPFAATRVAGAPLAPHSLAPPASVARPAWWQKIFS